MQDGVYHYMDGLQELWGAAFEEMTVAEGTMSQSETGASDGKVQSSPRKNDSFDRSVEVHYTKKNLEQALTNDESLLLDDRLHYRIHFPEKGKGIKIGSDFAETVTFHGDQTKLVVMRRDTQIDVSVLDVYNVNIKRYNGHIADLTREYEEAIKKHGAEWFERCYRFTSWDGQERLFSRWDRENLAFPAFEKVEQDSIHDETERTPGSSGIRSDRAGDAGSGEVTATPDGIEVDAETGSGYKTQSSARTWRGSDYVTKREEMAQQLATPGSGI